MTARHRRLVGAAAAALLAAPVVALAASAADDTAPRILRVTVTPTTVVQAASTKGTATYTVTAELTDSGGVDTAVVGLYDPEGDLPDGRTVALKRTDGTARSGTWTQKVTTKRLDPVGPWTLRAFAADTEGNMSDPDRVYGSFDLVDPTRVSGFGMGPEPGSAGGTLALSGRLQRYQQGKGWIAYSGKAVVLEFRAEGAEAFVPVVTRRTGAGGSFASATATKAVTRGTWRVTFAGNDHRAAAVSREDMVEVS